MGPVHARNNSNRLWLQGPVWLGKGLSEWPVQKIEIERDHLELAMKEEKVTSKTSLVTSSVISENLIAISLDSVVSIVSLDHLRGYVGSAGT